MSIITGLFAMGIALSAIGVFMTIVGFLEFSFTYSDEGRGRARNLLKWGIALLPLGMFPIGLTAPEVTG